MKKITIKGEDFCESNEVIVQREPKEKLLNQKGYFTRKLEEVNKKLSVFEEEKDL